MRKTIKKIAGRIRAETTARLAYRLILARPIDRGALEHWRKRLMADRSHRGALVDALFRSQEYALLLETSPVGGTVLMNLMHQERCKLVKSLPPAGVVVDLGGAAPNEPRGALLSMGYPHTFERLLIVDLPLNESHEQSFASEMYDQVDTEQGKVEYAYTNLADIDGLGLDEESVDLFWMGQSVEHISEEQLDSLLPSILKYLKPGGRLCLDTPNRRVTSIQVPDAFVHPDHKIEYLFEDLVEKIAGAGFEVLETRGIGFAEEIIRDGEFSFGKLTERVAINDQPALSYIFYIEARKMPEGEG